MPTASYYPEGPQEQPAAITHHATGRSRPTGRPKGPPSIALNLRLPLDLVQQRDRYLDHLEVSTGLKANRGMIARRALALFLETHTPSTPGHHASDGPPPPAGSR